MLVPSEIRKQINPGRDGDAFFLVPGVNGRPWLYAERYYEELVNRQRRELTPDEDQLAYDRMNLAMAFRLEWDKQGRILFPELSSHADEQRIRRNLSIDVDDKILAHRLDFTEPVAKCLR